MRHGVQATVLEAVTVLVAVTAPFAFVPDGFEPTSWCMGVAWLGLMWVFPAYRLAGRPLVQPLREGSAIQTLPLTRLAFVVLVINAAFVAVPLTAGFRWLARRASGLHSRDEAHCRE